jgi:4-hydroxybenzoate polyprenyltransferase
MKNAFKKLLLISRPISWPNTAYPFAVGYLISGGSIDAIFVIGTLYFLGPYNLLMYGINDVYDYESDIKNPRKGGIEGAVTSKSFHRTILWSALITNIPFIIALAFLGSAQSSFVLAVVVFFVIAYSIKHLRFKELPILDSISSSMHFVGPLLFALSITGFTESAWPYVIAFFLWGMASHAYGAVQDIIPDRAGKLSSIATVLGARTTVWFSLTLYSASIILVSNTGVWALPIATTGLLYIANILPYVKVSDETSATTRPGWKRFIWLNYVTGFVITMTLVINSIVV